MDFINYNTSNLPYNSHCTNNLPSFDPVALLMKRKQQEDLPNMGVMEYNQDDILELEDFCRKHNILGVNFGRSNPKSILNMLKNKIGHLQSESSTPKKLLMD